MFRAPLLVLLTAGSMLAQPSAPSLQNLIANSPFGVATVGANGVPAAAQPLEFRGTFVDGGERFFSLLDPATRRGEWVGLNEPGRPFLVKAYDPEHESISVEHQGRTLDLKLHSARIVTAALPAPAAAPNTPGGAPANAQARPATASGATEAQRLAQVAEEIRRRRALRQQATNAVNPEAPRPPPSQP